MKFRTEFVARQDGIILNPEESVVLMGSCFTDNIGERMRFSRWRSYPNPCGTLFNPASIARILTLAFDCENFIDTVKDSVVLNKNLWVSWLCDSSCTTYHQEETSNKVIECIKNLRVKLQEAKTLIVTFGTSWIYELKERPGYVVSNCHKFNQEIFCRRRLSCDEIVVQWNKVLGRLRSFNPNLKIIFTVSPVRHLKDGFEGNSRSKAVLQLACEELCQCNSDTDYFPSFEIMNDDLRDYRFYATDMVHPSSDAIEYIWQKFQDRYLTESSRLLLAQGEKVTRRLNHRPIIYGEGNLVQNNTATQQIDAAQHYQKFIAEHPNMLSIDD